MARVKASRATILAAAVLLLAGGCGVPGEDLYAAFQDEDPSVRVSAIARAGQMKDPGSIPYLVDRLTDSEKDVQFFAALALRRITGRRMGWNYYDPPAKRTAAVQKWRQWVRNRRRQEAGAAGVGGPAGPDVRSGDARRAK